MQANNQEWILLRTRLRRTKPTIIFKRCFVKNISTNKLQTDLSKIIKEAEAGEVYQVARYSKPVAYLIGKNEFKKLVGGQDCKKCVSDLRKIASNIKK